MSDTQARDTKLIQYLNEAYGKEKQLETALKAHASLTTRAVYKKRLRDHLKETKAHAAAVKRRVKALGGKAEVVPGQALVADVAGAAVSTAQKAAAASQGPLHAVRGTGDAERMLKNAKTEYADEAEEIANYTAIETLAEAVGDAETAKLARQIRRDEERMAKFLEKQIVTLTKEVVRDEVPAAQRARVRRSGSRQQASGSSPTKRPRTGPRTRTAARKAAT